MFCILWMTKQDSLLLRRMLTMKPDHSPPNLRHALWALCLQSTHCCAPAFIAKGCFVSTCLVGRQPSPDHTVIIHSDLSGSQASQAQSWCLKAGVPSAACKPDPWLVLGRVLVHGRVHRSVSEFLWGPVKSWNTLWCFLEGWIFLFYELTSH